MADSRIYLDANVMLAYIDGDQDRLPDISELFHRGERGEVQLITSALSMVEVAFAESEKLAQELDPEKERDIDRLWDPASPIGITEYHRSSDTKRGSCYARRQPRAMDSAPTMASILRPR